MVLLALGLILLGVMIGGAGLRRAGRLTRRIVGPWRPAIGGLALVALLGGAALAARGALAEGAGLAIVGLGLAVSARKRVSAPIAPAASPVDGRMSPAEARRMLGVSASADAEEIEAAYRRLMKRVHPDLGGAVGLAAQLNAARAALQG